MARSKPAKVKAVKAAKARGRRGGFWAFAARLIGWAIMIGVVAPVALVVIYKWAPPPGDILMAVRAVQGRGWDYRWRPIDRISPALVQAAVASEDARFCDHHGFDFDAIQKAMEHNEKHPNRIRGASTISQQTAKNVFLWPGRDWVRKGFEVYFTVLIEAIWGKERIMEVYLNVAEMGPGVYGAEAAARKYFKTDAAHLSPDQAARLVAVLPNPIKYKAGTPGKYVRGRAAHIGAAAGTVRRAGLAECVL
jgi:monofunctional biosynthetic peptidoglycan transglycosylase